MIGRKTKIVAAIIPFVTFLILVLGAFGFYFIVPGANLVLLFCLILCLGSGFIWEIAVVVKVLSRKLSGAKVVLFSWCVALSVLLAIGFVVFDPNRITYYSLGKVAERGAPLIESIKQYEKEYGHAPKTLSALVPKYLRRIPETGLPFYPDYEYRFPAVSQDNKEPRENSWQLYVSCSTGLGKPSKFFYRPSEFYGGEDTKLIKNWAFRPDK